MAENPDMKIFAPRKILLFCGKRKSGKDFVTEKLKSSLDANPTLPPSVIVRLSGPIKRCYADKHGLDFERLSDASDYKETHRKNMIQWSEKIRHEDDGFFCREALKMFEADKFPVWIVSDCRRMTDFKYFQDAFPGKCWTVRVKAAEAVRKKRGFVFEKGVDDAETECGLDEIKDKDFYAVIKNDGEVEPKVILNDLMLDLQQDLMRMKLNTT